jgi:hypothetical protein
MHGGGEGPRPEFPGVPIMPPEAPRQGPVAPRKPGRKPGAKKGTKAPVARKGARRR